LNKEDDDIVKKVLFYIHFNGFEYKNFSQLSNLIITGNVIQT